MATARNDIVNFFLERHIVLREEWLDMVLRFLTENNVKPGNSDALANYIYEQWLFSDLAASMEPSTSTADLNARLATLRTPMILQIKYVLDVSDSFYGQVKANRKGFVDNSGFEALTENEKESFREAKPQRTLTLQLTNGANEFMAIEYKPIKSLSVATLPGTKVLFIPPMKVRHGRFFLDASNFQVLGGDLDTYIRQFNPFDIMADHIKMKPQNAPKVSPAPVINPIVQPAPAAQPVAITQRPLQTQAPPRMQPAPTSVPQMTQRRTLGSIQEVVPASPPKRPAVSRGQENTQANVNRRINQSLVSARILNNDDFDNLPPPEDFEPADFSNRVIIEDDSDDEITSRSKTRRNMLNRVADISKPDEDITFMPTTSSNNSKSNNSSVFDNNDWGLDTQFGNNIMDSSANIYDLPTQPRTPQLFREETMNKSTLKRKSDSGDPLRNHSPSQQSFNIFQLDDPDFRISSPDKDKPFSLLEKALEDEFEKANTTAALTPRRKSGFAPITKSTPPRNPFLSMAAFIEKPHTQATQRFPDFSGTLPAHKRSRISETESTNIPSLPTSKRPENVKAKSTGGLHKFFDPMEPIRTKSPERQPPLKEVKTEVIELSDDEVDVKPIITPIHVKRAVSRLEDITPIPSPSVIAYVSGTARQIPAKSCPNTSTISMTSPDLENPVIKKYLSMKVMTICEAQKKVRFLMGSRRYNIQAVVNGITQQLRIVEGMWTMQVQLKDTTTQSLLLCLVDNETITKMIGWSAEEASRIQQSNDKGLKADGANRLKFAAKQMLRLDLLMEVEFFSGGLSNPIIRNITSLSQLLEEGQSQQA